MVAIPYYEPMDMSNEHEDHLHEVPDVRLKKMGYVFYRREELEPDIGISTGWYRRIGIVTVPDEVAETLKRSNAILTQERARTWL